MLMYGTTMFLINTVAGRSAVDVGDGRRLPRNPKPRRGAWRPPAPSPTGCASCSATPTTATPRRGSRLATGRTRTADAALLRRGTNTSPGSDARGMVAGLTLTTPAGDLLPGSPGGHRVRRAAQRRDPARRRRRHPADRGRRRRNARAAVATDRQRRHRTVQIIPRETVGASYGAAFSPRVSSANRHRAWNPPSIIVEPNPDHADLYGGRYRPYRTPYESTNYIAHALATEQASTPSTTSRGGNQRDRHEERQWRRSRCSAAEALLLPLIGSECWCPGPLTPRTFHEAGTCVTCLRPARKRRQSRRISVRTMEDDLIDPQPRRQHLRDGSIPAGELVDAPASSSSSSVVTDSIVNWSDRMRTDRIGRCVAPVMRARIGHSVRSEQLRVGGLVRRNATAMATGSAPGSRYR